VLSHLYCLVRQNTQVRAWFAGAQKHKSCIAVLWKEGHRVALVYLPWTFDSPRASEAPSLMTKGWQRYPLFASCIPEMLIFRRLDQVLPLRRKQCDIKKLRAAVAHK
jgi:hypothetical protein